MIYLSNTIIQPESDVYYVKSCYITVAAWGTENPILFKVPLLSLHPLSNTTYPEPARPPRRPTASAGVSTPSSVIQCQYQPVRSGVGGPSIDVRRHRRFPTIIATPKCQYITRTAYTMLDALRTSMQGQGCRIGF